MQQNRAIWINTLVVSLKTPKTPLNIFGKKCLLGIMLLVYKR